MEQMAVPSNPIYSECCVCGLRGQKARFTLISNILPVEEGNTSQTIITALGIVNSSPDNLICEACHLKIFNFKRFVLESNKTKQILNQPGYVSAAEINNVGIPQTVQGPQSMPLSNNSEIETIQNVRTVLCQAPNTNSLCQPPNTNTCTAGPQYSSNERCVQLNTTSRIAQMHSKHIPNSSTSASSPLRSNPYRAPFNLPPGTVMLKKQKSSVYILPDGTTIEILNQASGTNQLPSMAQPIRPPLATSSLLCQTMLPQKNPLAAVVESRTPPAIPLPSSIDVKVVGMDLFDGAAGKSAVILTDTVQIPTLLLPRSFVASAPIPPSVPTNSDGKVAIPRIKRNRRRRGPPMLLPKVAANVPKLQCPRCCVFFLNEVDLKSHLSTHPEMMTCRVCQAPALCKEELLKHMRTAHKEMMCSAEGCHFVSTSPQLLKKHILDHSQKKKHQCPLCGKNFKNATYLRLHRKRHAADREMFKCQLCDKLFKSRISLRCHIRFHELGFNKCPKCDKKFQFRESLRRHQAAMHSATAPFSCEICNQRCADKQSKLYHLKTHNKEQHKTVPCPVTGCNFRGFYEYRIRRHLQTTHKDYTGGLKQSIAQKCPFCDSAVSSVNIHLKEGECRLQLQTLVQEIVSSTYEGHMSSSEQRQEAAANVLKEYRTRIGASQNIKQLDSLTQEGNNEFIEALMGTISKLRERLRSTQQEGNEAEHRVEAGLVMQDSGAAGHKGREQDGDILTFSENTESGEVTLQTSNTGVGTGTVDTMDMAMQPALRPGQHEETVGLSDLSPGGISCPVVPPSVTDAQLEGEEQQAVPPGGLETYQEIVVEGEQISEAMIQLVESALQTGALESGTSFIIVDESAD